MAFDVLSKFTGNSIYATLSVVIVCIATTAKYVPDLLTRFIVIGILALFVVFLLIAIWRFQLKDEKDRFYRFIENEKISEEHKKYWRNT